MKRPLPWAWLPALGLLLGAASLRAQFAAPPPEQPQLLSINFGQIYSGVYAEGFQENAQYDGSPEIRQRRLFVGPLIGLDALGSIYHPNLFAFHLGLDGSLGWMHQDFTGPNAHTENSFGYLGSFTGNAELFDHKPLNGNIFSSYAHTYQDYDFFNRVYLDSWRYGGGLRFARDNWLFSTSAWHESQDATGFGTPTKTERTVATFDASQNRASGATTLDYMFSDYTRNDYGTLGYGQDHEVGAADTETFGSRDNIHTTVNASYDHLDNLDLPSNLYNLGGSALVDHSDTLKSIYNVHYQREDFGSDNADTLNGNAVLQHHLYQSLVSELGVQGYRTFASSGDSQQTTWQFGGGPGFTYTKKVDDFGRVTAFESLLLLHTVVESTGGIIPVVDEAHTFSTGAHGPPDTFFLSQPQVLAGTIFITDTQHQPPQGFIEGIDYNVIQNGQLTYIQRRAGSRMPDSVLVSYSFISTPSGDYNTVNNGCGIRFDFWDNLLGLYTRYNVVQNYGAEQLLVQNLNDVVVGSEVNWRFLRGGVEYEIYDSNLSSYKALRLFQALTFQPDEFSTFSLNLTETFTRYAQPDNNQEAYSVIARYNRALTRHLGLTLEGGYTQLHGAGLDQTLAVCRPLLQYTYGKFTGSLGYDFGYDEYLSTDKQVRNLAFIRLSRRF